MRLGGQDIGPAGGYVCGLLGIQTGQENLSICPTDFFHRTVRIIWPFARRGTQAVRIAGHHRLVLGLGYLVFTEVKTFGQGDIVLVLAIGLPTRFRGRTAHRKGARFDPEHIQFDRSVQVHAMQPGELETDTEAHIAVVAVTGGEAEALSRTQGGPAVVPGTTPCDPIRARSRSCGIGLSPEL